MTFAQCTWANEPAVWRLDRDALTVTTDRSTDFWRKTYYGFTRDTGHFFALETAGDFTAELRIEALERASDLHRNKKSDLPPRHTGKD